MIKWLKVFLWVLLVGLLGFGIMKGYVYYLKNKPHRDVSRERAIPLTAEQLFQAFKTDEAQGYRLYRDSAVQVTGEVEQVTANQNNQKVVYLKTSDPFVVINCTFKEDPGAIQKGDTITFRGICTGYLADANVIVNEGVLISK